MASLGGTVFLDQNADGTDESADTGLSGQTINLYSANGSTLLATTQSGSGGAYSFGSVTAGTYQVRVVGPGGFQFSRNGTASGQTNSTVDSTGSQVVTLGSSTPVVVNAGIYQPVTVAGTVFTDNNDDGQLDGPDQGLAGVTVKLLNASGTATGATAVTSSTGAYAFSGLLPGAYSVQVVKPSGDVFSPQDTSSSAGTGNLNPNPVNLLSNGSFETYTLNSTASYHPASFAGWTETAVTTGNGPGAGPEVVTTNGSYNNYFGAVIAPDNADPNDPDGAGTHAAYFVDDGANENLSQSVTLVAGQVYEVGFDLYYDGQGAGNPGYFALTGSIGGQVITTTDSRSGAQLQVNTWTHFADLFTPSSSGAYNFTFNYTSGTGYSKDVAVDEVYVVAGQISQKLNPTSIVNSGGIGPGVTLTSGQTASNESAGVYAPATVKGTIYTDQNDNGAQDSGDAGISGVTVNLLNSAGTLVATTSTGSNGAYVFTGVVPGTDTIQVVSPTGQKFTGTGSTDNIGSTGAASIVINSGATLTENAGLFVPAKVTGTVFTDANGDGARQSGETAVAGATVKLLNSSGTVLATTTSAADGTYSFANLTPGGDVVQIVAPTGSIFSPVGTAPGLTDSTVANTGTSAGMQAVTLVSGSAVVVNAGVIAPSTITGIVFADVNDDGTLESGDAAVAGVTVNLINSAGTVIATTTTGSNGSYSFSGVAPGSGTIQVVAPAGDGFSPVGSSTSLPNSTIGTTGTRAITLTSGSATTVNAGIFAPGTVTGTVFADFNADGAQQSGDAGYAGASVSLLNGAGTVLATTTTGSNGQYVFTGVTPGSDTVKVSPPAGAVFSVMGNSPSLVDSNVSNGGTAGVTITSGSTATVNAGIYIPGTITGTVFTDANANGVAESADTGRGGVTVNLISAAGTVLATTTTASDGSYSFTGVTPGTDTVQVIAPPGTSFSPVGTSTSLPDSNVLANGSASVTVAANGSAKVNAGLYAPGIVNGTVFLDGNADGAKQSGDAGVSGVAVKLIGAGGATLATTTTDANGNYSFANVIPGTDTVQVSAPPGYLFSPTGTSTSLPDSAVNASGAASVTITSGSTISANAGVYAPGTISGLVFGDSNADGVAQSGETGQSGVTISLIGAAGTTLATTTTDANGRYVFSGVTPGSDSVKVTTPAGKIFSPNGTSTTLPDSNVTSGGTAAVTVSSGSASTVNAGLYALGTVTGTVFTDANADGAQQAGDAGASGVTVNLIGSAGTVIATTATGANGVYIFTGVTPASDSIQVVAPAGNRFSPAGTSTTLPDSIVSNAGTAAVTVSSGSIVTANAGIFALGTITGTVFTDTNADGAEQSGETGRAGVTVNLINGSSTLATTTTASDGSYSFANVAPGADSVQVVSPSGTKFSPAGTSTSLPDSIVSNTGTAAVTITSGSATKVNAGIFSPGTVNGTVFLDGNADGAKQSGDTGVSGAAVKLIGAGGATLATTTTDTNGNYSFANVTPGTDTVQVSAPSGYLFSPAGTSTSLPDSAVNASGAASVTITSGSTISANAGVYAPGTISGLVFGDSNADGVAQSGETGQSGVTISLIGAAGTTLATTTTDANGRYVFSGVTPGSDSVKVTAPAGKIFSPNGTSTTLPDSTVTSGGTAAVTVSSGSASTVNAGLYALGTVTGTVFTDANADGAQQAGDAGASGVTDNLIGSAGTVIATTATGANGVYIFTGVTPASDSIQVVAPAGNRFSPAGTSTTLPDSIVSNAGTAAVTVSSGSIVTANAGIFALGTITGTVFTDTNADGAEQSGETGRAGVTVNLINGSSTLATTTTASDGSYSFANVAPGADSVQVVSPSGTKFSPAGTSTSLPDSIVSNTGTAAVTITSGSATKVNAGIFSPGTVNGTVFLDGNADGAKQSGDTGVSGAAVKLIGAGGATLATTTTDTNGNYSFANVTPGTDTVQVSAPSGYLFSPAGTSTSLPDSAVNASGAASVTITSGSTISANAGVYAPGTISGLVFGDSNADGVAQSGETGQSGVTISLIGAAGATLATTTTDANGRYTFTGVTPGTDTVQVAMPSGEMFSPMGASTSLPDSNVSGSGAASVTVTSGSSQTVNAGVFANGSVSGTVFVDANADGVEQMSDAGQAGVTVRLLGSGNAVLATTTTGNNGGYNFTGVTPGTDTVQVVAPAGSQFSPVGASTTLPDSTVSQTGTAAVTVTSNSQSVINAGIFAPGTVSGLVFSDGNADGAEQGGETGRAGVVVKLLSGSTTLATTTTDANGLYSFTGVTPGSDTVQVVAPTGLNFSPAGTSTSVPDSIVSSTGTASVVISSGSASIVNAGLYALGTVTGTVFSDSNADGAEQAGDAGVSGVTVRLIGANGTILATTATNTNGNYAFSGVTPGTDTVQVTAPSGDLFSPIGTSPSLPDTAVNGSGSASVTITSGSTAVANAGVYAPGTISGLVFSDANADGVAQSSDAGQSGVTISLIGATGATLATTTTDANGHYAFTGITPGSDTVQVTAPAGKFFSPAGTSTTLPDSTVNSSGAAAVTVISGSSQIVNAGLYANAAVTGTVFLDVNADGAQQAGDAGQAGITVKLLSGATILATTTTGANGVYVFNGVAPGTDTVAVIAPTGDQFSAIGTSTILPDSIVSSTGVATVTIASGGSAVANAGIFAPGTVSGTVFSDSNADGAEQSGETGRAGITVNLLSGSIVLATTTTGANGGYSFTGVTPGTDIVQVVAPAGGNFSPIGTSTTVPDSIVSNTGTASVTITSGSSAAVNAGLYAFGTVTGIVFADANADGAQQAGDAGVSGATVSLISAGGATLATTVTGATGAYAFTGVTPGTDTVQVTGPAGNQFSPAGTSSSLPDSSVSSNGAASVAITSGGTVSVNAGVYAPGTISGSVFSDSNADGVEQGGEFGQSGVTVTLIGAGGATLATSVTDGSGNYVFRNVTPGTDIVQVGAPAGQLFSPAGTSTTLPDSTVTSSGAAGVTIISGGAQKVNAGLYALGSVSGIVFADTNADGVQQSGESGQAGLTVNLLGANNLVLATTTTGTGGTYAFAGVAPGSDIVQVVPPAGALFSPAGSSTTQPDSSVGASGTAAVTVGSGTGSTVNAGIFTPGSISGFVFTDANADGVAEAGDAGRAGVTVNLLDANGHVLASTTTDANGAYSFAGVTPGADTIQVAAPAGALFSPQGGSASLPDSAVGSAGTAPVTMVSGGAATVDAGLYSTGTVAGIVFADANGDGVENGTDAGEGGVTVNLLDGSGNVLLTTTSAADGSYSFAGVTPGSATIQVVAPPGGNFSAPGTSTTLPDSTVATTGIATVTLSSGGTAAVNAGLYALGTIVGTVFTDSNANGAEDGGEAGLAGITVELLSAQNSVLATTATANDGTYSFMGVAPGTDTVQVVAPAGSQFSPPGTATGLTDSNVGATGAASVTLNSGGAATVNAGLFNQGSVAGTVFTDGNANGVLDGGDAGAAGVTVNLLDNTGAIVATTITAGDGSYSFSGVAPGGYVAQVVAPSGELFSPAGASATQLDSNVGSGGTVPVTVAAGRIATANAGVFTPGTVGGIVFLDANGDGVSDGGDAGIAGVTVELLGANQAVVATATTDGHGNYLFSGVTPGAYTVQVVPIAGDAFSAPGGSATQPNSIVSPTGTAAITVSSGGAATANAALYVPASVAGTVFEDTNLDGSQEATEGGLAGITVQLVGGGATPTGATAVTDSSGAYDFSGLAPGSYTVRVVVPSGDLVSPMGSSASLPNSAIDIIGIAAATVSSGQTATINAGLDQSSSVSGLVFLNAVDDGIYHIGDAGVAGVAVNLFQVVNGTLVATGQTAVTDSEGHYNFAGEAAGTYEVQFVPEQGLGFTVENAGTNALLSSQADPTTGFTAAFTLSPATPGSVENAGVAITGDFPGVTPVQVADGAAYSSNTAGVVVIAGANTNVHTNIGGNNVIVDGPGDDVVETSPGNDIVVSSGALNAQALGTNDWIFGGPGGDVLQGGSGNDYLVGGPGDDRIAGGAGNNTIVGGGNDGTIGFANGTISSLKIGDDLFPGPGPTSILFEAGDGVDDIETLRIGEDSITVYGYSGVQSVGTYNSHTVLYFGGNDALLLNDAYTVPQANADGSYTGVAFAGINFVPNAAAPVISLQFDAKGQPELVAPSVSTTSSPTGSGATGVTTIASGGVMYYLAGTAPASVSTTAGQASVVFLGAGAGTVMSAGADTIVGGAGAATVSASGNAVAFATGPMNFANGSGNAIVVAAGALSVSGGTGSVIVFAGSGDTYVTGGTAGNNVMEAGTGNATLIGGGNDDVFVGGAAAHVKIVAQQTAVAYGGSGSDTVQGGSGQLYAIGGSGQMLVTMGSGTQTNLVYGGTGGMIVNETVGPDFVIGGKGSILLNQGSGNDTVLGSSGAIQINAGTGFDAIQVYDGQAGGTIITNDFRIGSDSLFLGSYGAGEQQAALQGATFSSAGALLTLSDGTHITLGGVTQATLNAGIFS